MPEILNEDERIDHLILIRKKIEEIIDGENVGDIATVLTKMIVAIGFYYPDPKEYFIETIKALRIYIQHAMDHPIAK
ncbi:MAG TPA: hypothetical protein VIJ14_01815 [Rhabdochlamydiaceae bacterium]